uniref:DNA gyrase C-terminal beta-propeller domain-containing protein n=1 Tax=Croceibacter atlanticus TaxID=313588 RepID=UPI0032B14D51
YLVSEKAQVLRTSLSEIRNTGRATQGVTIFRPQAGDFVASIACVRNLKPVSDTDLPKSDLISVNGKGNGKVSRDTDLEL